MLSGGVTLTQQDINQFSPNKYKNKYSSVPSKSIQAGTEMDQAQLKLELELAACVLVL